MVRCHVSLLRSKLLYEHYKCQHHIQRSRVLASQASRTSALTEEVRSGVGSLGVVWGRGGEGRGGEGSDSTASIAHCMLGLSVHLHNDFVSSSEPLHCHVLPDGCMYVGMYVRSWSVSSFML